MNRAPRAIDRCVAAACLLWAAAVPVVVADEEAVWQWSVPVGEGRAYLWVPERCERVRGLVLAQHNMIEFGILQAPVFRRTLAELDMADVFIAPSLDPVYRFDREAPARFHDILRALAEESGYTELATAPVVPMGHSAHASFPWNFAAAHADRTLAVLSIKGDAPLTDLTGSGVPNPEWGERRIDGVPGLMVMSEQEWWEARFEPVLRFRDAHPQAPLAVLCDVGRGHFDATESLVGFLAEFVRKAAETRLPRDGSATLRPVDPGTGWVAGRWRRDTSRRAAPAPRAEYHGDPAEVFWCFDEAVARATDAYHAVGDGRRAQQVGFVQEGGLVPIATTHAGVELRFLPEADGLTFTLGGACIVPIPSRPPVATNDTHRLPAPTSVEPVLAPPDAHAPGLVDISVVSGPAVGVGPGVFRVAFDRVASPLHPRSRDIWLLAHHAGDAQFAGAVQQARLQLPRVTEGLAQEISFPEIADRRLGAAPVDLAVSSSAGLSVGVYVREGPAVIRDGRLYLTAIPPRARWPLRVTLVAWQLGRWAEPRVQSATPVMREFLVLP